MKCLFAIVLLALVAMAFAENRPLEPENLQPGAPVPYNAPRDKRGVVLGYASPYAYSSYSLPYAYSSYPYYYSSYYWG